MTQFALDLDVAVAIAPEPTRRQVARIKRDLGIATTVQHADAASTGWSDVAFAHLRVYVLGIRPGEYTTCECIREYAEQLGLRKPPDKRSWGAIMLRAAREKLLRKDGWTTAEDPKVHCNPVSRWVKP